VQAEVWFEQGLNVFSDISTVQVLRAINTNNMLVVEPWITRQPDDITVGDGEDAALEVEVVGTPLFYQWHDQDGIILPGAQSHRMVLEDAGPGSSGGYYAVIWNDLGAVTSRLARVNVVVVDQDMDGLPDHWETEHGLNPLDGSDAHLDNDEDGWDNLAEYKRGSHPFVMDLALQILPVNGGGPAGFLIRFPLPADQEAHLQFRGDLVHGHWLNTGVFEDRQTNRIVECEVPLEPLGGFYRVLFE